MADRDRALGNETHPVTNPTRIGPNVHTAERLVPARSALPANTCATRSEGISLGPPTRRLGSDVDGILPGPKPPGGNRRDQV